MMVNVMLTVCCAKGAVKAIRVVEFSGWVLGMTVIVGRRGEEELRAVVDIIVYDIESGSTSVRLDMAGCEFDDMTCEEAAAELVAMGWIV